MPLLAIVAGAIVAWCGFNGLNVGDVALRAFKRQPMPTYRKGSGLTDLVGPIAGYELFKAAVQGSAGSVLKGLLSAIPGAGGGGGAAPPPEEPAPPEEAPPELPFEPPIEGGGFEG